MAVTLAGNPIEVGGHFPQAGEMVENFTLVGNDLADISLNNFAGKRKVLNNTVVLCISADLPFAQARFCGAEGIENAKTVSTFRNHAVHAQLGVDIQTGPLAGLTSRAVIVLDEQNKVLYSQLV